MRNDKDYENAADWVKCLEQKDEKVGHYFESVLRRRTDKEFKEFQEDMLTQVRWAQDAHNSQRMWVLDAGALLLNGEGYRGRHYTRAYSKGQEWIEIDTMLLDIGTFNAEKWKSVRCNNAGWGLKVPRGLTNRLRKCERIAREYCKELRWGDREMANYEKSLLSKLRQCWDLICEAEDFMVYDLPPMTLEDAVDNWCEHYRELSNTNWGLPADSEVFIGDIWGPNRRRWKGE